MADTAALVVALSAQLTKFEKDMQKAVGIADKSVSDIEGKFKKLNPSTAQAADNFNKLFTGIKAGGIILLLEKLIENTIQANAAVAKIGETAETVGASTRFIQELRFALVATGGAAETADSFLEAFSRKVADAAQGTGDLYNFLRVNNIEAAKFAKLPLQEQVGQLADLMKGAATQTERLGIAAIASSRSLGPQMVQALQGGREGLKGYGDELDRLGGVLSEETIAKAKEANIEFQKQVTVLQSLVKIGAVEFFQLLSNAIRSASDTAAELFNNLDFLRNLKRKGEEFLGIPPGYNPMQDAPPQVTVPGGDGTTKMYNAQSEALTKLLEAQQKRIELMKVEQSTIGQTVAQQETARVQVELENDAKSKNIALTESANQKIRETAEASGRAKQALHDAQEAWKGLNSAVQFAGDQLINVLDGLINKTTTWQDALKNLQQALVKALLQAVILGQGPLGSILGFGAQSAGGTGGLLGGLVQGLTGKQTGGPVSAGRPYVVGEHGPELFVPKSSGQIVPSSVSKGGMGGGYSVVVNNYTSNDTETKQSRQQGPNGEQLVIDIVKRGMASGRFDDVNRGRFGLRAGKVR